MKHIIQTVKQVWKIEWKGWLQQVVITFGTSFIGIGMVYLIMHMSGDDNYGKLGTMIAIIIGVLMNVFSGIFSVQSDFNNAISMGKTRRTYVPAKYLVTVVGTAMIVGTIWMVNLLEDFLYSISFPNAGCEMDFNMVLNNPAFCAGYIVGIPAIALLLGGLYMKFGTKFFWGLWAVWMIGCLAIPRIGEAMEENPNSVQAQIGFKVVEFFGDITMIQGIAAFVICLMVVVVANILIFRKQRVVV